MINQKPTQAQPLLVCFFGFKQAFTCRFIYRTPCLPGYSDKPHCWTIWIIHYSLHWGSVCLRKVMFAQNCHVRKIIMDSGSFCSGKTLDMITHRCRYTPTQMTVSSLSFQKCLNPRVFLLPNTVFLLPEIFQIRIKWTSSQKLGRHALHRVRSVWKSLG